MSTVVPRRRQVPSSTSFHEIWKHAGYVEIADHLYHEQMDYILVAMMKSTKSFSKYTDSLPRSYCALASAFMYQRLWEDRRMQRQDLKYPECMGVPLFRQI